MNYIAHIRSDDQQEQLVEDHLFAVSNLAEEYGDKIGAGALGALAGILHDAGKFTEDFRQYIIKACQNPDNPPPRGSVDHSTAGGRILFDYFHQVHSSETEKLVAELVGNVIFSHHGGLQDFISPSNLSSPVDRRFKKEVESRGVYERLLRHFSKDELQEYIKQAEKEIRAILLKNQSSTRQPQVTLTLLMRYVFSCLIDADRTNTRNFEEKLPDENQESHECLFRTFYHQLMQHLDSLESQPQTKINELRSEMSEACEQFASKPSGTYTLSIPTGGGKTLASLRYALKHAVEHHKKRIIFILPYTSIIEQNAQTIRDILGDEKNIFEHHSNVIESKNENNYFKDKKTRLAKENWDAPIIFTTMVQYLDTFYSYSNRNARRLHNLADTVVIFDEVQSVPHRCISLFNESVNFLRNVCNSSILLCTATQPALDYVEHGIDQIDGEIVKDIRSVSEAFKRVRFVDKLRPEKWSTTDLAVFVEEQMEYCSSVLAILNTKNAVSDLYQKLKEDTSLPIYHLSTAMCAAHRRNVLSTVKNKLENGEKVICISTQLIEAGVDISFECVIRSLAGLDSIAQAAGRCNRNGEYGMRDVFVVNHGEESLKHLPTIKSGAEIAERLLKDIREGNVEGDALSSEVMTLYFKNFYHTLKQDLEYPIYSEYYTLYGLLGGNSKVVQEYHNKHTDTFPLLHTSSFETLSRHFQVIEQTSTSIVVPYEEGKELIADLTESSSILSLEEVFKKIQLYSINIFENQKRELDQQGALIYHMNGKVLELRESFYDHEFGLTIEENASMGTEFI